MVGHIFAFLLARACADTLGPFYGAMMKPLFVQLQKMARGNHRWESLKDREMSTGPIMIADGPRTLFLSPHLSLTCPSCPILENIIRGKTEGDGSFISLFSVSNALCFIHLGVLFFLSPFPISLSLYGQEEEEESSFCETPRCSQSIVLLAVRLN